MIDEYEIPVAAMDRAAYGTLESTYTNLKTVMEEVEGAREDNISKYSSSLETGGGMDPHPTVDPIVDPDVPHCKIFD